MSFSALVEAFLKLVSQKGIFDAASWTVPLCSMAHISPGKSFYQEKCIKYCSLSCSKVEDTNKTQC